MGSIFRKINRSFKKMTISEKAVLAVTTTLLLGMLLELGKGILYNSFGSRVIGFYFVVMINLFCLMVIIHFLIRIEQKVVAINYTKFIPSKKERLIEMTLKIENAKNSIYILSDLSDKAETDLFEHGKYLEALNKKIMDNKGNESFKIFRIIVPSSELRKKSNLDQNWIYKFHINEAYQKHFKILSDYNEHSIRHYVNGPQNITMLLIDNKYLFWKPEINYVLKSLETILDGGIFIEDLNQDGLKKFSECFENMIGHSLPIDISKIV